MTPSALVERLSSFKFLGVHISDDLTGSLNLTLKVRQQLYFLQSLKKAHLCPTILVDFYSCIKHYPGCIPP